MKTYRIGILGLHHDHVWHSLGELADLPNMEVAAAADPFPELREKFSQVCDAPVSDSYDDVLNRDDLDAVYLYTSNRNATKLAIAAMNRGLHALVEKPMAADRADAQAMVDAAEANGVRLMINWPFAWWYQLQHAIRLCRADDIGELWQVKYRAAHEGVVLMGHSHYFADWVEDEAQSGGGALIDYCCYGAVLSRVLLGMPESVSGLWGNYYRDDLDVDDNAVITLKYPRAMAIAEASWTQHGKLGAYTPIIYGKTGSFLVVPRLGGALMRCDLEDQKGSEVEVPEPEAHMRGPNEHFIWAIENPDAALNPLCDPGNCRDSNAIMDAGAESARGDSRLIPVTG